MAIRDTGTEEIIKETAKRLFLAEGKLHATMQDIADAAGVNRTLLHYYFRSKEHLFELVFKEALTSFGEQMEKVIISNLPFKEKIEKLIDVFLTQNSHYPYQELFLITEINSQDFDPAKSHRKKAGKYDQFFLEIQAEMDKETIVAMKPIQFMINLISLMAYPYITRPLFQTTFGKSQTEYAALLKERKTIIMQLIFK